MRGRMTFTAVMLLAALLGGLFVQNLTRVYADPPSAGSRWEYATFDIVYLTDAPDCVIRFPGQKMLAERTVDNLFQDLGPGLPDKAAATDLDVINRLGEQGWELASFDQRASQAANAYDQRWMFKRIKR